MPSPARRLPAVLLALILCLPLAASPAVAVDPLPIVEVPHPGRTAGPAAVPGRLIVRWNATATPTQRAAAARGAGAQRIHGLGGLDLELLDTRGRSAEAVAAALQRSGRILYAEPDHLLHFDANPKNEPWYDELWGLHNTGQTVLRVAGTPNVDIDHPAAARTTLGRSSVVVAVIDDGVDFSHPELADRAWRNPGETGDGRASNGRDDDGNGLIDDVNGWDFFHDDATTHHLNEDYHGTHVAGTIAGALNGIGFVGVAPRVKIMGLKFGDTTGGSTSDAIRAINYAARKGADVINASWGGPFGGQALRDAIAASGILFVAAAGNDGRNNDTSAYAAYPASYNLSNIIAVAAATSRGQLASFSNYGATSVDIAAPGTQVLSAIPATSTDGPAGAFLSGTSMAAPHVAGVAALVVSVKSGLANRPSDLRKRLMRTGKPLAATAGLTVTGKMVNAARAVDFVAPSVGVPSASLAKGTARSTGAVPVRIAWTASDLTSGLGRMRLQQRTDGGAWNTISLPTKTSKSITRKLEPGHTYEFRVRAWDRVGNRSAWKATAPATVVLRSESASAVTVSGEWTRPHVASALNGRLRQSDLAGSSATFSFRGRSVSWIAQRGPGHGKAEVYVNGTKVATIDLAAASIQPRRVVFTQAWSGNNRRTLEIRVAGTAGRPIVTVDGFAFLR